MLDWSFKGWALRKDAFSDDDIAELKKAASQPGALMSVLNYYRALAATLARSPG